MFGESVCPPPLCIYLQTEKVIATCIMQHNTETHIKHVTKCEMEHTNKGYDQNDPTCM